MEHKAKDLKEKPMSRSMILAGRKMLFAGIIVSERNLKNNKRDQAVLFMRHMHAVFHDEKEVVNSYLARKLNELLQKLDVTSIKFDE